MVRGGVGVDVCMRGRWRAGVERVEWATVVGRWLLGSFGGEG